MIGAIVKNNIVQNLIIIAESKVKEMEKSLDCEIVNAKYFGLQAGDLRTERGWTRNAGGEQMILQPLAQEDYNTFAVNTKQIIELKEQQPIIAENATQEALNILSGLDTEEAQEEDDEPTA